jgi:UDP-glucuronate 4-epimerase
VTGKTTLVTGAAGFIGSHTTVSLLERGDRVVGIDNLNDYYSPARKRQNLAEIGAVPGAQERFTFVEGDIRDRALVRSLFAQHAFTAVAIWLRWLGYAFRWRTLGCITT